MPTRAGTSRCREGLARTEIHLPLDGAEAVPERLRVLVAGIAAGRSLVPVAVVRTQRRADPIVRRERRARRDRRRPGAREHRRCAGRSTRMARARGRARHRGRAAVTRLGTVCCPPGQGSPVRIQAVSRPRCRRGRAHQSSASGLIGRIWPSSPAISRLGDLALRRGGDVVHKTRVAARRYRSAFRVFGRILDRERATWLDEELSWYQDLLGQVRDRQVLRQPPHRGAGRVTRRIGAGSSDGRYRQTLLA